MAPSPPNDFTALRQFVRRGVPEERCELCAAAIAPEHEHLFEPAKRKLLCTCQACAILFSGQSNQRYKRVPTRIVYLPHFRMTKAQWDSLMVPINMAFFTVNSVTGNGIAVYPSPAGATESQLALETWSQIVSANFELQTMESDVEALLVNRLGPARGFPNDQYFVLPIDQCYKLVGLVRMHWRGLSGGDELWQALDRHFASLLALAGTRVERSHA